LNHCTKTVAEINLDYLEHNYQLVKKIVGKDSKIIFTVKANAYGHGLIPIARFAQDYLKTDILGVAMVSEGILLRKKDITLPILVYGGILPEDIPYLLKYKLTPTLINLEIAELINQYACQNQQAVQCHINIDTGMGRIGFKHQDAIEQVKILSLKKGLILEGIYTHFPSADSADLSFSYSQVKLFNQMISQLKTLNINFKYIHCANSSGIINLKNSIFNMVRPGLFLYGYYSSKEVEKKYNLKPVLTLKSKIVFLKKVFPGETISYNRTYSPGKETIIATVPIGYGDGFNRLFSNSGEILVKGVKVPIVGNVTMDQIMIDLGNHPQKNQIKLGDEVVIYGKQEQAEIHIDDLAEKLNTINYEILCQIDSRVQRKYLYHLKKMDL